jgi:hypothetical protein
MTIPFSFFPCSFFAHNLSIANKIKQTCWFSTWNSIPMLGTFVLAHLNSQVEQLLDVEHIPFLLELSSTYMYIYLNFYFYFFGGGDWGVRCTQIEKNSL